MDRPPFWHVGRAVHGRAHQRMTEPDAFAYGEQPVGLARGSGIYLEAVSGGPQQQGITGRLRRCDQQQQTCLLWQSLKSPPEALLDAP